MLTISLDGWIDESPDNLPIKNFQRTERGCTAIIQYLCTPEKDTKYHLTFSGAVSSETAQTNWPVPLVVPSLAMAKAVAEAVWNNLPLG